VEFAKRLGALDFEYSVPFSGPVSSDVCGSQQVTVTFYPADRRRAYIAEFKYQNGQLVEAVARTASVSRGKVTYLTTAPASVRFPLKADAARRAPVRH
jgi:hypothetical protein